MIRINLMRNRAQGGATQATSFGYTEASSADSSEQKLALKNLLFLFVGIGLLLFYEKYNRFNLNDRDLLLVKEYSHLEQQLNKEKTDLDRFKSSESEAKILEDKLTIIRKLSKIRLREVKALDYIQEIIPDKVWLKQIIFDQETVRISGFSILDEDLSGFVQTLDRSSFFQNVVLSQAIEVATKSGTYKQFDVAAKLESVP